MNFFEDFLFRIPGMTGTYANFPQVCHPVYIMARNFGFLPFTIKFNEKYKVEGLTVSYQDILRFLLALIVYSACAIYLFKGNITVIHDSLIIVYGSRLIMLFGLLLAILSVILDMINRKSVTFILKEIIEIDEEVIVSKL